MSVATPAISQELSHPNKRIVLCLDGTWNSGFEEHRRRDGHTVLKPTNPLKLCRSVLPVDAKNRGQLAYYDIGIGALAEYPGFSNRLLRTVDRTLGGAWGAGFEGNVEDSLNFLVLNFEPGDEVYLFGFSRGAAQARAVAHFLDWSGGLPGKDDAYYLPLLFRRYVITRGSGTVAEELATINENRRRESPPLAPLAPFRAVPVKYLGVFDTVMALGSRFRAVHERTSDARRSFYVHDMPPRCVERARQALAVDEMRFDFRPEIWTRKHDGQQMEQRWFPGVHSNVGGSYGNDGLANTALHWIKQGAIDAGLEVDGPFLKNYKPWFGDSIYDSYGRKYRLLDRLRQRAKKGKRSLELGAAANASLDPAVIHRMQADPATFRTADGSPGKPYRPRNVIEYLALQKNLDEFLAGLGITKPLPEDVLREITSLRAKRGGAPIQTPAGQMP